METTSGPGSGTQILLTSLARTLWRQTRQQYLGPRDNIKKLFPFSRSLKRPSFYQMVSIKEYLIFRKMNRSNFQLSIRMIKEKVFLKVSHGQSFDPEISSILHFY